MNSLVTIFGGIFTLVGMVLFFGLLMSFPVMLLWNYCLVPAMPAVLEIGWLQAWGILILSGFLFKTSK